MNDRASCRDDHALLLGAFEKLRRRLRHRWSVSDGRALVAAAEEPDRTSVLDITIRSDASKPRVNSSKNAARQAGVRDHERDTGSPPMRSARARLPTSQQSATSGSSPRFARSSRATSMYAVITEGLVGSLMHGDESAATMSSRRGSERSATAGRGRSMRKWLLSQSPHERWHSTSTESCSSSGQVGAELVQYAVRHHVVVIAAGRTRVRLAIHFQVR